MPLFYVLICSFESYFFGTRFYQIGIIILPAIVSDTNNFLHAVLLNTNNFLHTVQSNTNNVFARGPIEYK